MRFSIAINDEFKSDDASRNLAQSTSQSMTTNTVRNLGLGKPWIIVGYSPKTEDEGRRKS